MASQLSQTQLNLKQLQDIVQAVIAQQPTTGAQLTEIVRRQAAGMGFAAPKKSELLKAYNALLTTGVG